MAEAWEQLCVPNSRSMKNSGKLAIPDKIGRLLYFASEGDVEAVTRILDEGLDVNSADYDKRTAMHLAASEGHVGVVELLLKRGAHINPIDRWGETPLANARKYKWKEVCDVLVANKGTAKVASTAEYEIDPGELELGTPIGSGAYGEVRRTNWRGTWVAAKTVIQRLATNQRIKSGFIDELALLQTLRHPNIVQFLGAVTKRSSTIIIVTEYLPRGDLHEILRRRGRIPAREAVQFALDIARGMNYLHQHKPSPIVHRDLKPRNLLQDEAGHLKVADFGLSKLFQQLEDGLDRYRMTGATGSYRYMAPEVYRCEPYDKSVDVYSFAIIVQEMFEGPSFKTRLPIDVAEARANGDARPLFSSKNYPPKMKDLLRQCCDENPKARPTFAQIITRLEEIHMNIKRHFWTGMPICSAVTNIQSSLTHFQTSWHRCVQHKSSTLSLTVSHDGSGGSHRPARPGYAGPTRAILPE